MGAAPTDVALLATSRSTDIHARIAPTTRLAVPTNPPTWCVTGVGVRPRCVSLFHVLRLPEVSDDPLPAAPPRVDYAADLALAKKVSRAHVQDQSRPRSHLFGDLPLKFWHRVSIVPREGEGSPTDRHARRNHWGFSRISRPPAGQRATGPVCAEGPDDVGPMSVLLVN